MDVTYNPTVFDVTSMAEAQAIILTPEDGLSPTDRWATETPYLGELIQERFRLGQDSVVLDYGCGVGRLSKELIQRTGCRVVGVDISINMRILAPRYVESARFSSVSPEVLRLLVDRGMSFDVGLAVWVLQHCWKVREDIELLRQALPGGQLFVLNEERRCVPVSEGGWVDDGLDVSHELRGSFSPRSQGRLPPEISSKSSRERTYWRSYQA